MKISLYILTAYAALWSVIWLHEVGHALILYRYKCKANPFKVTVPFYLFGSTPLPIDTEKVSTLSPRQDYNVNMAGVAVNLIVGTCFYVLIRFQVIRAAGLFYLFLYLFTVFHFVEALSYVVINNIFLASDMTAVQNYKPILRIPLFIVGVLIGGLVYDLIRHGPIEWAKWVTVTAGVLALGMGICRIVFTWIHTK